MNDLKTIRLGLGLSQTKMAARLGIEQSTVSLIENQLVDPGDSLRRHIEQLALNVKPLSPWTAAKLKSLRRSRRLKQRDLAKKLGISLYAYGLFERDVRQIRSGTLVERTLDKLTQKVDYES